MSDTVASRREARRRKVLENAENRLTKISGNDKFDVRCENNFHVEENGTISSSKTPSETFNSNGRIQAYADKEFGETHSQKNAFHNELNNAFNDNVLLNDILNNDLTTEESKEKVPVKTSRESSNFVQHICLICLAVVVRLLFAVNLGFLVADSMIVPFLLMTLSRLILVRKQPTQLEGLFRSVLLLGGVSPQRVSYLMKLFTVINLVTLEFSIYLFTFVAVHTLLGLLWTS